MSELNFIEAGSGDRAVVMLHSLGLDALSWRHVVDCLAAEFRALALDLPGHGDTPARRSAMTIEDFADAVATFIDGLDAEDVTIVGNSFGSLVAVELARRDPPVADRVVLLGCPLWRDRVARSDWLHDRSATLVDDRGVGAVPAMTTVETIFGSAQHSYLEELARGFGKARHSLLSTIWAIYAFDGRRAISEARVPVLAAYGTNDWLRETADGVPTQPGFALGEIAEGSHLVPVDRPVEVAQMIAEFASGRTREAPADA